VLPAVSTAGGILQSKAAQNGGGGGLPVRSFTEQILKKMASPPWGSTQHRQQGTPQQARANPL